MSDTQLKKLKNAVKNKTGTALRINIKMFNGNDLLSMNYYWQQDKKQNEEMHLTIICQLI